MTVVQLTMHKKENNFKEFYNTIHYMVPELKNFMTASLKAAENQGKIDRQYYDAYGMLDDVYLSVFKVFQQDMEEAEIQTLLFRHSLQKISELVEAEKLTPNHPSTGDILKDEMDALDEMFTAEADGDLIFLDELDDISYNQERRRREVVYLDESLVAMLIVKLGLEDKFLLSKEKRRLLGILYEAIPPRSKSVMELYVYGDRTVKEISVIMEVDENHIQRILKIIAEKFRLI